MITWRACARPAIRLAAVMVGISSDRFDRLWVKFAAMSRAERKAQIRIALDAVLERLDTPST